MASSMPLKRLVSTSLQRLVRPASLTPPSYRFFHTSNADRRSGLSIFGHRNNFFSANGSGSGSGSLFQAPPRTYLGQSKTFTRGFAIGFEKRNLRDHKRRLLAEKYEMRRKLYKALCGDVNLPIELREKNRYKLSKLPRNSAFGRLRNRCIFTGRPRAVYRKFRISRIVFRELASKGSLMGVKKASW